MGSPYFPKCNVRYVFFLFRTYEYRWHLNSKYTWVIVASNGIVIDGVIPHRIVDDFMQSQYVITLKPTFQVTIFDFESSMYVF